MDAAITAPAEPSHLVQEFTSFMSLKTNTTVVIDRSPKDDLLRINFNIRCVHLSRIRTMQLLTEVLVGICSTANSVPPVRP